MDERRAVNPLGTPEVGSIPPSGTMNITHITAIVPLRRDYHVVPDGPLWKVVKENTAEPEFYALTKAEAIGYGIEQARLGHVSLVMHGKDGRIQNVWSYDNAPDPLD